MAALRPAQLRATRVSVHCPYCDEEQYLLPDADLNGHSVMDLTRYLDQKKATCNSCDKEFHIHIFSKCMLRPVP
jgi:uncharacterized Zn-finger protein